jgi:hypothetical protein
LKDGTQSAGAGELASIPQTAKRLAAPMIRIAHSVSLEATLERLGCREKNA